jgi:serine/threonine protein kinase
MKKGGSNEEAEPAAPLEPTPPPAPKPKSAMKGRGPMARGATAQFNAAESGKNAEDEAAGQAKPRARPSMFKMTYASEEWSARGLCKHYFHMSGQKMLWTEQEQAAGAARNKNQRKSIKLGDLGALNAIAKGANTKLELKRSQSIIIEDRAEQDDSSLVQMAAGAYKISPLKDLLIAKKPNVAKITELLESLGPEVPTWIDASLDETPPPMPSPLIQMVAGGCAEIVQLLIDSKADVLLQYTGKSMLKGWIKPNTPLAECCGSRKMRFVGTMLGDKLAAIEQMLIDRAEAKDSDIEEEEAEDDRVTSKLSNRISSKVSNRNSTGVPGCIRPSETGARKSIQVNSRRGLMLHTQGHPNLKYELINNFDVNQRSSVREASNIEEGDGVVIKAGLKNDELAQGDPEAELWAEIGIMRKLQHPNVIQLVETFEDETHIFLVFELAVGGELFDRLLLAEGGFPQPVAKRFAYQMASGIRHLHQLNICHRDIQPESFHIADNGPLEETGVKLLDFITAKEFVRGVPMTTKICTLHYVAPEIFTSAEGYSEKVDIWSWGVLYYVMTAGVPPFNHDEELDILAAIKTGVFDYLPKNLWAEVGDDVKDVISKTVIVDSAKRLDIWGVMDSLAMVNAESDGAVFEKGPTPKGHVGTKESSSFTARTAFLMLAEKITDDQINELRNIFRDCDHCDTGMVEIPEIREQVIGMVGTDDSCEELRQMLSSETFDGKVNYTMCLATMADKRRHIRRDAAHAVFNMFDIDKNGNVSLYELAQAIASEMPKIKTHSVSDTNIEAIWTEMVEVFGQMELDDTELTFEQFFRQLPRANLVSCF